MALQAIHNEQTFRIGDTVRVYQQIEEYEAAKSGPAKADAGPKGKLEKKTRTQVFAGTVIAIRGEGQNKSFTVRRLGSAGIGIERIFPIYSPLIEKVEVAAKGAVRRAKLYYIREKPAREVTAITKRYTRKRATLQKERRTRSNVDTKSRKVRRRSSRKASQK